MGFAWRIANASNGSMGSVRRAALSVFEEPRIVRETSICVSPMDQRAFNTAPSCAGQHSFVAENEDRECWRSVQAHISPQHGSAMLHGFGFQALSNRKSFFSTGFHSAVEKCGKQRVF